MRPLLIWGAGGHARVVADVVRLDEDWDIAAFLDDVTAGDLPDTLLGRPLYRSAGCLPDLRAQHVRHAVIAIGDCRGRLRCAEVASANGMGFATLVHPTAVVASGAVLGHGSVLAAGALIGVGAELGRHVVVNSGSIVEHDARVGDGAHVGPGACVGARARIGRAAFIGMRATVLTEALVEDEAYVGAGSLVLRGVPAGMLAYGVPARTQSLRPEHD